MSPDIEAGKRSWVFEALMMLVEKKPYNKITMEDISSALVFLKRNDRQSPVTMYCLEPALSGIINSK